MRVPAAPPGDEPGGGEENGEDRGDGGLVAVAHVCPHRAIGPMGAPVLFAAGSRAVSAATAGGRPEVASRLASSRLVRIRAWSASRPTSATRSPKRVDSAS